MRDRMYASAAALSGEMNAALLGPGAGMTRPLRTSSVARVRKLGGHTASGAQGRSTPAVSGAEPR